MSFAFVTVDVVFIRMGIRGYFSVDSVSFKILK